MWSRVLLATLEGRRGIKCEFVFEGNGALYIYIATMEERRGIKCEFVFEGNGALIYIYISDGCLVVGKK
jgi:hypothetical protein